MPSSAGLSPEIFWFNVFNGHVLMLPSRSRCSGKRRLRPRACRWWGWRCRTWRGSARTRPGCQSGSWRTPAIGQVRSRDHNEALWLAHQRHDDEVGALHDLGGGLLALVDTRQLPEVNMRSWSQSEVMWLWRLIASSRAEKSTYLSQGCCPGFVVKKYTI